MHRFAINRTDHARSGPRLLVCDGALDPHVPLSDLTAFAEEMNAAGADWQLIMYGGALHGFTHSDGAPGAVPVVAYDPVADSRSFSATRGFPRRCLRSRHRRGSLCPQCRGRSGPRSPAGLQQRTSVGDHETGKREQRKFRRGIDVHLVRPDVAGLKHLVDDPHGDKPAIKADGDRVPDRRAVDGQESEFEPGWAARTADEFDEVRADRQAGYEWLATQDEDWHRGPVHAGRAVARRTDQSSRLP